MKGFFAMQRYRVGQWVLLAVLAAAGCGQMGLDLGPVPVEFPIGSGAIDPSTLVLVSGIDLSFTTREDFCALPTEQDVVDRLPEIAGIDMGRFVKLTHINLSGIVLTATSGDFSFLREITVSFVPKPVNGQEQEPVVIGHAQSDTGFADSVVLSPPDDVDLLDLIRANDDNPDPACPQVQISITGSKPDQTVQWEGKIEADIYAKVGA